MKNIGILFIGIILGALLFFGVLYEMNQSARIIGIENFLKQSIEAQKQRQQVPQPQVKE